MKNPIPRVAAIHDLSGLGRVSLMVVIPILSTMGIQVTPLPTAVLSAHTGYKDFQMLDLTNQMDQFIEHWKKENLRFDAIYSGFLGSHRQIKIVKDLINHYKNEDLLVIVDPVLGDDGKAYSPMTSELVDQMKDLITVADMITPNLTEVCMLLDEEYNEFPTLSEIKDWALRLSDKGPSKIVITSVRDQANPNLTSVIAYTKKNNSFWKVSCSYLPTSYPGTGDIFTSVLSGALLQGDSFPIAIDRAVQFTSQAVRTTYGRDYNINEGVLIERILDSLKAPLMASHYELI